MLPRDRFDPVYYRERYDPKGKIKRGFLFDYPKRGRAAGWKPVSVASTLAFDTSRIDPSRETVLMVSHQASRTGAPILAYNIALNLATRYNVVVLLLESGALVEDFKACTAAVIGPISRTYWHQPDIKRIVERILSSYKISYAIANTIDSRTTFKPLSLAFTPVVALVHEFPLHLPHKGQMGRALEWATKSSFLARASPMTCALIIPPCGTTRFKFTARLSILPLGLGAGSEKGRSSH